MKSIDIPESKSDAHRALFCAALSRTKCNVPIRSTNDDIEATRKCAAELAAGRGVIDVGESGATLRFALPIAAALGVPALITMHGRLPERPLSPLDTLMTDHGCKIELEDGSGGQDDTVRVSGRDRTAKLTLSGQLTSGDYTLPGNISSQFVSGLLLALPMVRGDSRIIIEGDLESEPYVYMTLDTMEKFGISIPCRKIENGRIYQIKGGQNYMGPETYSVQGDWSGAANWIAAGVIGKESIDVRRISLTSKQGDKAIYTILKEMGAHLKLYPGDIFNDKNPPTVLAEPSRDYLHGIDIDAADTPDIVPILALVATQAIGETVIYNASRLRLKESDRIASTANALRAMGAEITELSDGMIIKGRSGGRTSRFESRNLHGATVVSENDHRIAMMGGVASLVTDGRVLIEDAGCVSKSYPAFFSEMSRLKLDDNLYTVDYK